MKPIYEYFSQNKKISLIKEYLISKEHKNTVSNIKMLENLMKDDIENFKPLLKMLGDFKGNVNIDYGIEIVLKMIDNGFVLVNDYDVIEGFRLGKGNWIPFERDTKVIWISKFGEDMMIIEIANAKKLTSLNIFIGTNDFQLSIATSKNFNEFELDYNMNEYNYATEFIKTINETTKEKVDKYINDIIS